MSSYKKWSIFSRTRAIVFANLHTTRCTVFIRVFLSAEASMQLVETYIFPSYRATNSWACRHLFRYSREQASKIWRIKFVNIWQMFNFAEFCFAAGAEKVQGFFCGGVTPSVDPELSRAAARRISLRSWTCFTGAADGGLFRSLPE